MHRRSVLLAAVLAMATVGTIPLDTAHAQTVFEIGLGSGWVSPPDCTGTETLVVGPGVPPEGVGSLQLSASTDQQVACVVTPVGLNVRLASVSGTWSTFIPSGQVAQAAPTLKFRARLPGFSTVQVEPFFQTQQAPVTGGVWQTWTLDDNALIWATGLTGACSQVTPCRFADFKAAHRFATITALELGIGSFPFVPLPGQGYVDAVHLTTAAGPIDADFEAPTPPTPVADTYATTQDHALIVAGLSGVLVNDKAVNQHPMTAALAAGPAHGAVTLAADGGFTYTPNAGFTGSDSFTYTATDTVFALTSAPATVTITVTPIPPLPQPTPPAASKFTPLAPHRLVDTRTGLGGVAGPLAAQSLTTFAASGGGLPASGVTAVVLNVTATEPQAVGFVQVFPAGAPVLGSTSTLNVDHPLQTIANLVIVGVDASSHFSVFNQSATQLAVDVFGYFTAAPSGTAGRLVTVDPIRVLDTRTGPGPVGKIAPLGSVALNVTSAVPADATSVVMTLTADQGTAPGFIQAIPTGGATALGASSNLNVDATGEPISNTVIVPIGADGTVTLFSQSGAHLIADVVGYFTGASAPSDVKGLFVPIAPSRVADSRVTGNLIASGATLNIALAGRAGLTSTPPSAIAGNVTATNTTASGYVQVIPSGSSTPIGSTSTLNISGANRTIAATNILSATTGSITVHNQSATHLLYDVTGFFT